MRKTIIVFTLLLLASLPAFCQRFYLQPTAAVGFTNAKMTAEAPIVAEPYEAGLGYIGGVRAGIDLRGLRIGTGVEFMHISTKYISLGMSFKNTYDHLLIPVYAGYSFAIGNRFSLVPSAGAAFSINFFHNTYPFKKTSLWGCAQLDFEYKLNNNISLTAGPKFYQMLGSIVQHPPYSIGNVQQWHYGTTLCLGALMRL